MNIDKKYYQEINENLTNTIQDTNIDAPNKKVGKVRDAYFLDNKVVMVSTDRQSAFDRVLGYSIQGRCFKFCQCVVV